MRPNRQSFELLCFFASHLRGYIFIIYIPGAIGIRRNITRNDDIRPREIPSLRVRSRRTPSGGYINALLYRKNTWIKKKKSLIFKTNNANSRLFGELTRAWLPRVVTTNDIPPYIPRSKPYTMVICPAAFIYHAY